MAKVSIYFRGGGLEKWRAIPSFALSQLAVAGAGDGRQSPRHIMVLGNGAGKILYRDFPLLGV